MQTNALRGLLYEFGEVLPEGYRAFADNISACLARVADRLPGLLVDSLREQWTRVQAIDGEIAVLERRLAQAFRNNEDCRKLSDIPGVGLLTATAMRRSTHSAADIPLGSWWRSRCRNPMRARHSKESRTRS